MPDRAFRKRIRTVTALAFAALYMLMAAVFTLLKANQYWDGLTSMVTRHDIMFAAVESIKQQEQEDESFTPAQGAQQFTDAMAYFNRTARGVFYVYDGYVFGDFAYPVVQYYDAENQPLLNNICMLTFHEYDNYERQYILLPEVPDYDTLRSLYAQRPERFEHSNIVPVEKVRVQGFQSSEGFLVPQIISFEHFDLRFDCQPGLDDILFDTGTRKMELYLPAMRLPTQRRVNQLQKLCENSTKYRQDPWSRGYLGSDGFLRYEDYRNWDYQEEYGYWMRYTTAVLAYPMRGAACYMLRDGGYAALLLPFAITWAVMMGIILRKKEKPLKNEQKNP